MDEAQVRAKLTQLCQLPTESEIVEFKGNVGTAFTTDEIGKYFSALSNEANLHGADSAWLVFGVQNKTHQLVGTRYRNDPERLNSLKRQIADSTTGRLSFLEIYVVEPPRIILFHIPAAPRGIPISWKGFWYARDGETLTSLNIEKIERIRNQAAEDWSKRICHGATIDDLDTNAILQARSLYKQRYPEIAEQVNGWDDSTFLNKAKVTIQGQITNTAIVLLGKSESEHFISPAVAKIRWVLKDSIGNERDYLIKTCPLILSVNEVSAKIRNLIYRLTKEEEFFPEEMSQYSPDLLYEALNNCIAHQDYTCSGRINVVEKDSEIIFTNYGDFIPGSVERVIKEDAPEERYRNDFLCSAMFNFRMVQTRGGGIRMMFNEQAKRFFPLPEYDLSNNKVKVTIVGKVLDMEYANVLARDTTLTLPEIMMLDKVQKGKKLSELEFKHLKEKNLIEGRRPNIYISARIAQATDQKAAYTRLRGLETDYYHKLIIAALKQHHRCSRRDFNELLLPKLPEAMSETQKRKKVDNLLYDLKKQGKITNEGSNRKPSWGLAEELQ